MTVTPSRLPRVRRKFHDARAFSARGSSEVSVWRRARLSAYGIAASAARCAAVGSWSMASAWSGWVAITTASYPEVTPLPSVTSTASAVSRTEVTLAPSRTSSRPAATLATYSREPPTTVRHCGEPVTASIPWWARNWNR